MSLAGLSRSVIVFSIIIIVVAIAAFLGGIYSGIYIGGSGAQRVVNIQTATIPSIVTATKTITQAVASMPTQQVMPTQQPTSLPDKIVIGVSIQLSGTFANEGRKGFWGIMAAVNWVNQVYGGVHLYGRAIPIEVKYYDDESKRENIVSYTERLITVDKVNFLIGPYSSALAFAQAPIAEKYRVLVVNWGAASDVIYEQGYRYVVSVIGPASKYMWSALYALKSVEPTAKVAVLYKDDEFNRIVGRSTVAKAGELGLTVVYEKSYPADIKDFSPYITDLARSGADALLVGAHYADGQLLTKQLADSGVNFKFIAMTVAPSLAEYYASLGKLAEGISCPVDWAPGLKYTPDLARKYNAEWFGPTIEEFTRFFTNVTGDPKTPIEDRVVLSAAAVLVLVKAIETAQSLDPTAVREAFNKLNLLTILGPFKIDPLTGKQAAHTTVLAQWQGGKLVVTWPPDTAQAKLYYPIPTWDEKRAGKTAS